MIDDITNSDSFKLLASIVTGGAFVGWFREHRRAKKDAATFSIEFMKLQAAELAAERKRVDDLVGRMAQLEADHSEQRAGYRLALMEKDAEILRLRTELAHYAPRTVVADPTASVTPDTNPGGNPS
jgi:hypothetical protein